MKVKTKLGMRYNFKLVKWDDDVSKEQQELDHPEQHPKCAEIMEWTLGSPAKTTYKRD